jgi:hypothetical protein
MISLQCLEFQFLLRIIDTDNIRCKVFTSVPDKIRQRGECIRFAPIAPEGRHKDPEFHHFAAKLRKLHREIIVTEKLTDKEKDLACETVLAWAAGKFAKDWVRERKINAAQAQRLRNAVVWPW